MIVIVGARGQVGSELVRECKQQDLDYKGVDSVQLDVTNPDAVMQCLEQLQPTTVINAAAYTNVDGCETHSDVAMLVNAEAPRFLAQAAHDVGAQLIHISTDYVFDGKSQIPYVEEHETHPINVYGMSKQLGETAVLETGSEHCVVRTSWVYGETGNNFVRTMMGKGAAGDDVSVVTDQVGQPTWARDLAQALIALSAARASAGLLHFSSAGQSSWFEFAQAIFTECGWDSSRVLPVTSEQFHSLTVRPQYSVLAHSKWLSLGLPAPLPWQDALSRANISQWKDIASVR